MLTGIITKEGLLKTKRAGEMKYQNCPFHPAGLECGDWCPKFGEPAELSGSSTELQLCGRTKLSFTSLEDKRGSREFKFTRRKKQEEVL